ncbi:MAG: S-layer homology domain-containing protein [Elainella sp. C42_A2020_010]|nr:S-layer homology domain-containing protein [Elainella sp. C42_A2020_010]
MSLFGSFCYGASATEPLQMPLEMIVTPSDLVINRPTHSSTAEADTETIIEPVIDSFAVEIDTANDTGSSIDRAISDRATADSTDVINSGVDSSTAEVNPTDTIEPVEPMHQVTEVTQLSDVNPTDWAFQALQSLVERYGCIVGYPDGTFRGERALSRYEFAAGLNACLERLSELLAATTADLVQQSDLETLQKLQEEFPQNWQPCAGE